jgi:hypothetical protein
MYSILAATCVVPLLCFRSISGRSNQAQERGYIALHDIHVTLNTEHLDTNKQVHYHQFVLVFKLEQFIGDGLVYLFWKYRSLSSKFEWWALW